MVIDSSYLEFLCFGEVGGVPLFSCEVGLEYYFLPLSRLKTNKPSESNVEKVLRSRKTLGVLPRPVGASRGKRMS